MMADIVGTFRSYALDKDNCPRMSSEAVPVRVSLLVDAADEIERLRAALEPFANALKGNWSHQSDEMPIDAGFGATDLRLRLRLGDFRAARAALGGEK